MLYNSVQFVPHLKHLNVLACEVLKVRIYLRNLFKLCLVDVHF